jgi:hypothetical protein
MRTFATAVQIYIRSSKMKLPFYTKYRFMNIVIELAPFSVSNDARLN